MVAAEKGDPAVSEALEVAESELSGPIVVENDPIGVLGIAAGTPYDVPAE